MLITEFYANQEIFVTGGTGFLGKALIEKLLRDCPKIKAIYMLMRGNKTKNVIERFEDFKQNSVFDRIRKECPQVLTKLCAIEGDSKELALGIMEKDLKLLENVSIIFHMAANVKFNDPLRSSILLNARGTHELVKIAEKLKNLTVFLHCSTAYCNPLLTTVEEKVYSTAIDWRKAIKIAETYDEDTINALFKKYSGHFPNTYTFTKNISEHIIKDYSSKLPMFIFRPAVVVNALREPFPGWTDNITGVVSASVAMGVGIAPTIYCIPQVKLVLVPIDVVTKLTIVAAYKRGIQKFKNEIVKDGLEVVNCGSKECSSLTFEQNNEIFLAAVDKNPFENCIWRFGGQQLTSCYYLFFLYLCLINIPVSIVADSILRVMGKIPMGMKMTRHILVFTESVGFFSDKSFDIKNSNMLKLETIIPERELETFGTLKDCQELNFKIYLEDAIRGIRKNIFNQPNEASDAAHLRHKIFFVINTAIKFIVYGYILKFLWFNLY